MRLLLSLVALPLLAWQQQGGFDRTLAVNGPVDLEVQTAAGSITVQSGDASSVRIHAVIRAGDRAGSDVQQRIRQIESNPPIQQTGNTIRIGRLEDESLRRNISISYEISTPPASQLKSHTGSGSVRVSGIQGPLDAATGSGRIELDGIQGKVDARTGSGSIHARAVAGPSVLRTGSGSIHLDQTAAGPVQAHTGSGSVEIHLPGAGGFEVHARTGSGRVHVEPPMTVSGNLDRHGVRGQVRGGGPLVDVSTGSGQVTIN